MTTSTLVRFASPPRPSKTERSRRTIKLPPSLLPELARHRKEQASIRLKLGLGKDPAGLLFTSPEGDMLDPTSFTEAFTRQVAAAGVTRITFHGLRHTHITHLLRRGLPVHVVAARAGQAKASTTLDMYAHLLGGDDDRAAEQVDEMLALKLRTSGASSVPIRNPVPLRFCEKIAQFRNL
jgi:integrase